MKCINVELGRVQGIGAGRGEGGGGIEQNAYPLKIVKILPMYINRPQLIIFWIYFTSLW